jgi:hypothetical protein
LYLLARVELLVLHRGELPARLLQLRQQRVALHAQRLPLLRRGAGVDVVEHEVFDLALQRHALAVPLEAHAVQLLLGLHAPHRLLVALLDCGGEYREWV